MPIGNGGKRSRRWECFDKPIGCLLKWERLRSCVWRPEVYTSEEGVTMKVLAFAVAVSMFTLIGGCSDTPAYTAQERSAHIWNNEKYLVEMMQDQIDAQIFMDRPSSQLTYWNVWHRD